MIDSPNLNQIICIFDGECRLKNKSDKGVCGMGLIIKNKENIILEEKHIISNDNNKEFSLLVSFYICINTLKKYEYKNIIFKNINILELHNYFRKNYETLVKLSVNHKIIMTGIQEFLQSLNSYVFIESTTEEHLIVNRLANLAINKFGKTKI